eukprot:4250816-Prymnesium_polylepis.1
MQHERDKGIPGRTKRARVYRTAWPCECARRLERCTGMQIFTAVFPRESASGGHLRRRAGRLAAQTRRPRATSRATGSTGPGGRRSHRLPTSCRPARAAAAGGCD